MNIGNNIKLLRNQRGLSQAKLAALIDVDRSAIAQWENGISYPRMNHLNRVAEILETTSAALVGSMQLMPAYIPIVNTKGVLTDEALEVPVTLLERHSLARAYVIPDNSMNNLIPFGLAAIFDPELIPANGQIAVVAVEGCVMVRRLFHGTTTLMLATDSKDAFDDIIISKPDPACILGTVIWISSTTEMQ